MSTIALANGVLSIVGRVGTALQQRVDDRTCLLRNTVLIDQRHHGDLNRRELWVKFHHHPRVDSLRAFDLLFVIGITKTSQHACRCAASRLDDDLTPTLNNQRFVCAKWLLADLSIDERIAEAGEMVRGLPYSRMHNDRRVEVYDVFTTVDCVPLPRIRDITLELDAQGPVVIGALQPTIDF